MALHSLAALACAAVALLSGVMSAVNLSDARYYCAPALRVRALAGSFASALLAVAFTGAAAFLATL